MMRNINQIGITILLFSIILTAYANNYSHCFDVLNKYTWSQINNIYQFKVENVANTSPANTVFECYLKETRKEGVKSDVEKHYDVYKKCNEYKKLKLPSIELKHVDELENIGLPMYLDNHVRDRINHDDRDANDIIKYIQDDLGKKIEMSDPYNKYRNLVHEKLTTVKKSGQKSLAAEFSIVFVVMIAFLLKY